MKKIFFAVVGFLILASATAQNKVVSDANAQVRSVNSFHALKVSTGIHLYLTTKR